MVARRLAACSAQAKPEARSPSWPRTGVTNVDNAKVIQQTKVTGHEMTPLASREIALSREK
jgi:hypothetical protein